MIALLLILIPLITGVLSFFIKGENSGKQIALFSAIATLVVLLTGMFAYNQYNYLHYDVSWLPTLGSRFSLGLDGMGKMLCLLTAVSFPIIFAATYNNKYKNPSSFYGLMLLTQAGLMGVFLAMDCLLFYFFWELALIPVYFLCSIWGGEKRIAVTFKFFIYTFIGSLLMLVGILYLYFKTADQSFALQSFYNLQLSATEQNMAFWLFFIAFAIKMPIFPFHTWQPDTYEQAPTATTMVLSGIMVKMGVFAVIRWILPILPDAVTRFDNIVIALSVIGMIYASLIAIKQDDLKRFVAWSSIAHIGLMCAAIFTKTEIGLQGVMIQMFSHGINIIGMWIVVDLIEKQTGTRKISELGGIAHKAPALTIFLVVIALANIALPLTNAFVGEFMMFSGLFTFNVWYAAVAGLSIILAAVYTLNMVQKVFYGQVNSITGNMQDISLNQKLVLSILLGLIFLFGIYPQPIFDLTKDTVAAILTRIK